MSRKNNALHTQGVAYRKSTRYLYAATLDHPFRSVEQSVPEKRLNSFPEANALLLTDR